MFTGLTEQIATVTALQHAEDCVHLAFSLAQPIQDLQLGESIAVNGVCLTVTTFTETSIHMTAVPETLRCTNLGLLNVGSIVNIERSLQLQSRLGGHYVQGHVDGVGEIISLIPDGASALLATIKVPPQLAKFLVPKGYICLDGMSVTIVNVTNNSFSVTFIPYTQSATIVSHYQVGTLVNLEIDILTKSIYQFMEQRSICNPI